MRARLGPARRGGSALAIALAIAIVAPLVAVSACGPALEPVGLSTGGRLPEPAPTTSASAVARWAHADAARAWPASNAKRFPSGGHFFGRFDAEIRANEAARATYASIGPGVTLPAGAVVAELLVGKDGTPGPILAMEKGADGWVFVEAQADGTLVRKGALSPCVECHTHVASQDSLFGVPTNGR